MLYYLSWEDAAARLQEMSQSNGRNLDQMKIMAVGMDKILKQIETAKQSRRLFRKPVGTVLRIRVSPPLFPPPGSSCAHPGAAVTETMRQSC